MICKVQTPVVCALAGAVVFTPTLASAASEVNIYSYRQEFLIRPLLDAFTKKTGIKANVIFAKKGLVERMKAEGETSPADILLTVDIGRLTSAVAQGVSQPVKSDVLEQQIPAQFRGDVLYIVALIAVGWKGKLFTSQFQVA